jgi:hypothetical protein
MNSRTKTKMRVILVLLVVCAIAANDCKRRDSATHVNHPWKGDTA